MYSGTSATYGFTQRPGEAFSRCPMLCGVVFLPVDKGSMHDKFLSPLGSDGRGPLSPAAASVSAGRRAGRSPAAEPSIRFASAKSKGTDATSQAHRKKRLEPAQDCLVGVWTPSQRRLWRLWLSAIPSLVFGVVDGVSLAKIPRRAQWFCV